MPELLASPSDRDRPRERLWSLGPAALTTAELLAILIGTGVEGRGVLEVASRLLERGDGSLRRLAQRPRSELLRADGIGPTKAARLLAAFELGGRLAPPRIGSRRRGMPSRPDASFGGRMPRQPTSRLCCGASSMRSGDRLT
jgi:DNA repair protein RadC